MTVHVAVTKLLNFREVVMKGLRKFRRDSLRKNSGSRNLEMAWANYQMEKYENEYKAVCSYKRGK